MAEAGEQARRPELKIVFVPLDGSGLAEKILPHVITVAKRMKLEVHLVRVYSRPADVYVVGDGTYDGTYMDNFAQQKEVIWNEVETYFDGKTQKLRAEGLDRVLSGGSFLARPTITLAGFPDSLTQSTRRGRGKGAASHCKYPPPKKR